jgi:membrane-bound inhibitor of C-type lysozyme
MQHEQTAAIGSLVEVREEPYLRGSFFKPVLLAAFYLVQVACSSHEPLRLKLVSDATVLPAEVYIYECDDDYSFLVRIAGETASLILPSGSLTLTQVEAASGAKYSNGHVTFWNKGRHALLEIDQETRRRCKNNQAQVLWDIATLLMPVI